MFNLVKNAYLSVPLKNVFKLVRRVGKPSKNTYWFLRFRGDFTVPVDDSHSFRIRNYGFSVENSVFWAGLTGEWEAASMKLWIELVKDAEVIFDIGANTGIYSLVAKSLNPESKVYAFEPVKRIFEKLEYNNRLNQYDIVCFDSAASNADGTATIYDLPTDHLYSVTINKNLNAPDVAVIPTIVKTIRLDSLIKETKIDRLDLIKLDVETYEAEVLEGLGEYLDKFKPTMLVEVLNDEIGGRIEVLLAGKGYLYFNIDEDSGSVRRVEHITKSDYYNYLICSQEVAKKLALSSD